MPLADKQRTALVEERGEPKLRLEFDVFADGHISMWTHFDHGGDFSEVKQMLIGINKHLTEFIADESMCPFHKPSKAQQSNRALDKLKLKLSPIDFAAFHNALEPDGEGGMQLKAVEASTLRGDN